MAKQKKNAFTIVELIVAMGLLVMLVGLSSVVFSTTVKAHRKATATIEITRNLNVLTEQLNKDFQGLRKDAPLMFWFEAVGNDDDGSGTIEPDEYLYYDTTHFFADGYFQSIRQYNDGTNDVTISGNLARIYYGHANSLTASSDFAAYHVLSRKSHILTADSGIFNTYGEIPLITSGGVLDYTQFVDPIDGFGVAIYTDAEGDIYTVENCLEFNTITLSNWINALNYLDSGVDPDNANHFISECMDDDRRPYIDLTDYETLHLLMAQGVLDFSIQWAYTPDDLAGAVAGFSEGVRWWPSVDPAGDGSVVSDFTTMGLDQFGVYFELPNGASYIDWFAIQNCETSGILFPDTFYPKALKFTFRLKDSNNVFPDGKTFSHIVYLDN